MARVPRLLPGVDPRSLNLSAPEAYLLSRVDALLNEHDLALVTGVTPAEVSATLERLAKLGAIELVADAPPAAEPRAPAISGGSAPAYDPAELDEAVDLDPDRRRRVLELFYRLDDLTYYALLDVTPETEKKQIKSAYYAIAPEYHPDKYFRKNLGSYKHKIETIFARITLAHDVLTVAERRREYDEYLEQTSKNRANSAVFDDALPDVASIMAAVEQAAARAVAEFRTQKPAAPVAAPAPAPRAAAPAAPAGAGPSVSPEETLRLRREALARKLTGAGRRPGAPAAAAGPAPRPPSVPAMDAVQIDRAAEALRQRHEAAIADAKRGQLTRYLETGRAALESQDYAGAANAYRIAASLSPDDPAVQATCNDGLRRAAATLADGYWKQALYEESQDRWGEAALSYSKVCTGRPDSAQAHERVAYASLKSAGNPRRAVEFARKAVELDPKKPDYHVTLGRAYAAAGLEKSAQGELARALELAPKDAKVQALVAHARSALHPKDGK
jgi:curved DNA-binding protein CbpA